MTGPLLGYVAGLCLALVIVLAVPSIGFVGGLLLGFGLPLVGVLIGRAADR